MDSVQAVEMTNKISKLKATLDGTADVLLYTDELIAHYRELYKETEKQVSKRHNDLSQESDKKTFTAGLINRCRNSAGGDSCKQPSKDQCHVLCSTLKSAKSNSPKSRCDKNKSSSYLNLSDSSINNFSIPITEVSTNNFSTPVHESNREQIKYHLKRIQQQIEADQRGCVSEHDEFAENLSDEIKSLREVLKDTKCSKEHVESLCKPSTEVNHDVSVYKKKIETQQATIRLLTEQLDKKENEVKPPHPEEEEDLRIKLLQEKLIKERNERMKVMKDYSTLQENLNKAEDERSELLATLTDVKVEARTILKAYEEISKSIPELEALLEQSAKQKSEFSNQVMKFQCELENNKEEIEQLKKERDECQSSNQVLNKELEYTNEQLTEAKQSCTNIEKSKEQLHQKALNTIQAYRLKCRKYEKQLEKCIEQYKLNEIELSTAVSQRKELEEVNLKQKEEFEELSQRMEKLQGSIDMYVEQCHQVTQERNEMENILSQSNVERKEYEHLMQEKQQLKDNNSLLSSQLQDEKEKRLELEKLVREHSESNVALRTEKSLVQHLLETANTQLCNIRVEYESSVQEDTKAVTESNLQLMQQLQIATENAKITTEKHEEVKRLLDEQKIQTRNEITKSVLLVRKLKSLASEHQSIREHFQLEKETLEERLVTVERLNSSNQEQNTLLQKYVDNVETDKAACQGNIKIIIDFITKDISSLLYLLCDEEEHKSSPVKEFPHHIISPENQAELIEMREKLESCFCIITTLKERFNEQKTLIKRARERMRSQIDNIHKLTNAQQEDRMKYEEQLCENNNMQRRIDDLQKCVNRLSASHDEKAQKEAEVARVSNQLSENIAILDANNNVCNNEHLYITTNGSEYCTEELFKSKNCFNEVKEQCSDRNDLINHTLDTFQIISPSKKRRLYFADI